MSSDSFDLNKFKLSPEQVAQLAPLQKKSAPKARAPRSQRQAGTPFVQLPYRRALAVAGRLGVAPMAVLIEIGYLAFKAHGKPVPLANKTLATAGIDRWAKTRALRELEKAELVTVIWRGNGRSPLVSLRWD
jgi:hypothetical protein